MPKRAEFARQLLIVLTEQAVRFSPRKAHRPFRVSPAFRSRFACEWNVKPTISKGVIGIFRLRFAVLQNSFLAVFERNFACNSFCDKGLRLFRIDLTYDVGTT